MLYCHFSTSAALPFLKTSAYSLCSLDTMMYTHGYAPMSGEVNGGGLVGVGDDVTTAFAGISYDDTVKWNVAELYKEYGKHQWQADLMNEADVEASINFHLKTSLVNVKPLIVNLLRHKQMGKLPPISLVLQQRVLALVNKYTDETLRQLAANYVVAKYLRIADNLHLSQISWFRTICDLENRIPSNFLLLSPQEQRELIGKLVLPEGLIVDEVIEDQAQVTSASDTIIYALSFPIRFPGRTDLMSSLLELKSGIRKEKFDSSMVGYIRQEILLSCERLVNIRKTFERIFDSSEGMLLTESDKQFIMNPFPIAFILTNGRKLRAEAREFRSTDKLVLGYDIKTLATDPEHVKTLQQFITQGGIRNVRVITTEQLKTFDGIEETSTSRWGLFQGNAHQAPHWLTKQACYKAALVASAAAVMAVSVNMMLNK